MQLVKINGFLFTFHHFNINGRDVQRTNVVNNVDNVDKSGLWAP